ncbi:MAG: DNA primase [Defluviitaleaceae bacterium]|nr:DNA primase [Defluviitaleaceae bacterium]
MRYPEEVIQEVIGQNDIVDVVSGYVALSPRAGNHFGICPFHGEKTPSFSVNQSKQIFYCFGCHTGGSVLTFIMKIENLDFLDALKLLADRARYRLPEKEESASAKEQRASRELSAELNKRAARFYHDHLYGNTLDAQNARQYLEERGIHPTLAKRFGLGLSPTAWDGLLSHLSDTLPEHVAAAGLATQNRKDATRYYDRFRSRLMFPIIDTRNRVVGFGGRIMGEGDKQEAKYVNTPETALFHKSDNLYGLNLARKTRKAELIIVEGYMDVLAMHQWGFTNTVGVLGTALNDSHVRLLKNAGCTSVVLMLDGDEAGVRATLRAIPPLTKGGIRIKTLNITEYDPGAKDPDEYLQRHGAASLTELLRNAKSHIAFQVELYKDKHDMDTIDGRVSFTQEAAKLLSTLPSAIETEAHVSEISKISDISESAIHTEINKQKGNAPMILPTTRRRTSAAGRGQERSIKKAKETLLHLILTHHAAAAALEKSGYLSAREMGNGIYTELLELAFNNAKQGKQMNPVDVISAFESGDLHHAITEVFIDSPEYETKAAIEKSLNETAFIIKRAWALHQMQSEDAKNCQETLQSLGLMVRNMPSISI